MPLNLEGRKLSASVWSTSTLLMALVFTLCLSSLPPPFSWVDPTLPNTWTWSQYVLAVPEKKGKEKESNPIQTRRLAGWNMRHITTWDTNIGTILNADYTGENLHDPKIYFLKHRETLSYRTPIYSQRLLFIPCNSSWCHLFTRCFCEPWTDKGTNRHHIMMEI